MHGIPEDPLTAWECQQALGQMSMDNLISGPGQEGRVITITELDNGYMLKVGCKTFVFHSSQRPELHDLFKDWLFHRHTLMKNFASNKLTILNNEMI